jgi:hypothetical protein
MQGFDLEALIRACLIGLSVAIIGRYIIFVATRDKTQEGESQRMLTLAAVATFILVSLGLYYSWPTLPTVPVLDKLSQADAENLLFSHKLVPQPRPQISEEVPAGLVIPHSQDPSAGINVRPGTTVSFGVSVSQQINPHPDHSDNVPTASLYQPKSGEGFRCTVGGDGICRCKITGTSSGVDNRHHLLLWLKPVRPPSDQFGWYLERSGNGINRIEPDGTWVGVAQVGNAQYPPHERDVVDVAVSVVDDLVLRDLMGKGGVVVEPQPIGLHSDISSNVVITFR